MDRKGKQEWRDRLGDSLGKSQAVFLAHYAGLTVEDLASLRRELRATQAEFKVVKNTILKKAVEGTPEAALIPFLTGQTGIVFAYGDAAATAKALGESAKKLEKLEVRGGFMDSGVLSPGDVVSLASLPSREVLLGKIVGSLVAPHRGMLGILQGVPGALVRVLGQIQQGKVA